jgi:hypothetical protein
LQAPAPESNGYLALVQWKRSDATLWMTHVTLQGSDTGLVAINAPAHIEGLHLKMFSLFHGALCIASACICRVDPHLRTWVKQSSRCVMNAAQST